MESGFIRENSSNLLKVDILMVGSYFASNNNFCASEIRECENIYIDFYFFEFLSNEYRRGFVEMHFGFCSLIHKDPFFGAAMRQGRLAEPCPYPPGDYHMYNMSIPPAAIPPGFPFRKGRIYANLTHRGVDVVGGHIDMELKEKRSKDRI